MSVPEPILRDTTAKSVGGRLGRIICYALGALVVYMLTFGPVVGFGFRRARASGMGMPRWLAFTYGPAELLWHSMPKPLERAYAHYIGWWIDVLRVEATP